MRIPLRTGPQTGWRKRRQRAAAAGQSRLPWLLLLVVAAVLGIGVVVLIGRSRLRWLMRAPAEKARVYHHMKEYDKAVAQYEQAVHQDPENADLLMGLAQCHLARARLADAASWAERAAGVTDETGPLLLLARIDLRLAEAEKWIPRRTANPAVSPDREILERARRAARYCRQVLERQPDHSQAHEWLAKALLILGERQEAIEHGRRAVALEPDSGSARVLLARLLVAAGEDAEALEQCRHAIRSLKMQDSGLLLFAARLSQRQGRYDQAVEFLQDHLRQPGAKLDRRVELAECYRLAGQYERAVEEASRVVRHYERRSVVNPNAYRVRGLALIQLARYPSAIADLRRLISISNNDAKALHWLGVALLRTGETRTARERLMEAARLEPRSLSTHEELAALMAKEGNLDDAVAEYRRAIQAVPDETAPRQALVQFAMKYGLDDVALRELRALFRMEPTSTDTARALAEFHLRHGETSLALELTHYALRGAPEDADLLHLAGRVLAAQGRRAEAATRFAQAARQEPTRLDIYLDWVAVHAAAPVSGQAREGPSTETRGRARAPQPTGRDTSAARIEAAEAVFQRARRAMPQSRELRRAFARFLLRTGRTTRGVDELRHMLRDEPTSLAARVALVDHFLMTGQLDSALEEARAARQTLPKNPPTLALLARVLRRRQVWDRFVATLDEVAEINPDAFVAYQRVPAHLRLKNYEAAIKLAQHAQEAFPEHRRRIGLDLAIAQCLAGHGTTGADTARRQVAQDPMDGDAGYVVSLIELADKDKAPQVPASRQDALAPVALAAWTDLRRLHQVRPAAARQVAERLLEALVYENAGWSRLAAETCERILKDAPRLLVAQTMLPVLWERAGERQKAIDLCEKALADPEASPHLRVLLSDLLLLDGKPTQAREHLKKATRELPRLAPPRVKLALLTQALGEKDEARRLWLEAFRDFPRNATAANNAAWALVSDATAPRNLAAVQISQLRSATGAALAEESADAAVEDTAGWSSFHLGESQAAIEHLERARSLAPHRAVIYYHLGRVYAAEAQDTHAAAALRQAIRLDPDGPIAVRARRALTELRF
jgi:tetratricopeptide (TPR) repeat protein